MIAAGFEVTAKARKTLQDDAELAQLLGRLSDEKKEYRARFNCYKKVLSIKLWPGGFRNRSPAKRNAPSRISGGSEPPPLGVKPIKRPWDRHLCSPKDESVPCVDLWSNHASSQGSVQRQRRGIYLKVRHRTDS